MKTIEDLNINQWYMDRQLTFTPVHFTKSNTMLSTESLQWINEKTSGRFSLYNPYDYSSSALGARPAFEDPKEAVFFELMWG